MVNVILVIFIGVLFLLLLSFVVFVIVWLSWKIPVVVLRYAGDKRRPVIVLTKGKTTSRDGVNRLLVKGYKWPIRNFKSEYYYPYIKGKKHALLLWEPKPGILTPTLPSLKGLEGGTLKKVKEVQEWLNQQLQNARLQPVDFRFDDVMYKSLLLKAVDDTDIDFMLQHIARVESQYVSGWRDFLSKYGSHMVMVVLSFCLLAGFIVWLEKSPEWAASCANAAQETTSSLLKEYVGNIAPPPG